MTEKPNRESQTKKAAKKNRSKIPRRAELEILNALRRDMQIDAREAAAILEKHHVRGNTVQLQHSYRLRLAQQFLSRIRDEQGRREVFCASKDGRRAYVVVDGCTDEKTLKSIRHNLSAGIEGLDKSISKISLRTQFLDRLK